MPFDPTTIKPEDCPEPFWHETHRYCPACSWTERPAPTHRRFVLDRSEDATGISGTGTVVEGVQFSDGTVTTRWVVGEYRSHGLYPSIAAVEAIHGHDGLTKVRWLDEVA